MAKISSIENVPTWKSVSRSGKIREGAVMTYHGYCPTTDLDIRETVKVEGIYTKNGRTRVKVIVTTYDDGYFFCDPNQLS
jgi:hypothetical protein